MSGRREFILGAASGAMALSLSGCTDKDSEIYSATVAVQRAPLVSNPNAGELIRFATLAANSHNTQPWRFAISDKRITIVPDLTRRTPAVDPDDHHLFVSLGCAAENLSLAARSSGLSGEVSYSNDNSGRTVVETAPTSTGTDSLALAIPHRQTTRSEYDGRTVSSNDLKQLEAAARMDGVSLMIITDVTKRDTVRDYVTRGNSAQIDDPAFVRELKHWIRYNAAHAVAKADGLFSRSSGNPTLPPWLGSLMFDLVFTKSAENKKYSRQISSSSGIAVFTGDKEDKEHWVKVGRSFQRFALQATALGIRHAHINQPVEVPALRSDFAASLGIGKARPDLVIRFGYAPPMPMSLRRQVSLVIDSAS
ncbi:MAG: Acg family FMN-binding oxidoreductase [Beijerinckiaceae bacterium]